MPTQVLSSTLKTLDVLAALAETEKGATAAELARTLGRPRNYVHRQLITLCAGRWAEQGADGVFRLGLRVVPLSRAAMRQAGLGERAAATMEDLAELVNEAVSLAVLDGEAARIIHRVEADRALRADPRAEVRMPISKSASGQVLTAFADPGELERLAESGVELPSEHDLAEVRDRGYACSAAGYRDETVAVAVPIYDWSGRVLAALSVVGPVSRFVPEQALAPLSRAAEEINESAGGRR